jgi:hypothetical protein
MGNAVLVLLKYILTVLLHLNRQKNLTSSIGDISIARLSSLGPDIMGRRLIQM